MSEVVARLSFDEFPIDKPLLYWPYFAKERLEKQGIKFEKTPFFSLTAQGVQDAICRPWVIEKDFEGTITVRQGEP